MTNTYELDEDDDDQCSIECIKPKPLSTIQQITLFVNTFAPDQYPKDIIYLISYQLSGFEWKLGLLLWRPYAFATRQIVRDFYGNDADLLQSIFYKITECIQSKKFDKKAIENDVMNTSPNKSFLVSYITKVISHTTKGLKLNEEKKTVHRMLYDIITDSENSYKKSTTKSTKNGDNEHKYSDNKPAPIKLQFSHSAAINIRVLALESLPSPSMGLALQSSADLAGLSPLSLMEDISNPFPGDESSETEEASWLFDTFCHEYPEKGEDFIRRVHKLVSAVSDASGNRDTECIDMDLNHDDTLNSYALDLLLKECPHFLRKRDEFKKYKPFVVSKAIDLINRKAVTMNIVNLFTEIRMASHYIEMLKNKDDCDYNENILELSDFLRDYPLFESLRNELQYEEVIHCLSSTVTHIVHKVLRPLPLQATHIIHDSYQDYLWYITQISRFIHNQNRAQCFDNYLNALPFPLQIDFLIIPQCVSETKIEAQIQQIHDYDNECERLLFGIGDDTIGSISEHLAASGIKCKEIVIKREYAHFYKTLCREFESIQNKKRYQRYVVIIDRRCPVFDGRYALNHNERNWRDRLYIYQPPKYNEMHKQCDILPEGFIHRTQNYLLPFKENGSAIGANCVANGYMFCLSYHLCQDDHIKTYFHYNGYGQRFTRDELKYYLPTLFMKIGGKPQNDINCATNQQIQHILEMFKDTKDEQHIAFHQQTMK